MESSASFNELAPGSCPILSSLCSLVRRRCGRCSTGGGRLCATRLLRRVYLKLRSVYGKTRSGFFGKRAGVASDDFLAFNIGKLLRTDGGIGSTVLFGILSCVSGRLLAGKRATTYVSRFCLFLAGLATIRCVHGFVGHIHGGSDTIVLTDRGLRSFGVSKVQRCAGPLFSVPARMFLFGTKGVSSEFCVSALRLRRDRCGLVHCPRENIYLCGYNGRQCGLVMRTPRCGRGLFKDTKKQWSESRKEESTEL